ncbi:MAG TPA: hypothetical protein VMU53_09025 [Candidatus Sulfotelmatobacter sp.]|nr:hypothetical protein [Candidatus Sulfotelmatobacter sp.]
MRHRYTARRRQRRDSGYALLLMMFFLALLVLSLAEAAPTVLSSIQRERETEMVWRGKQYTRGIRMYYMKMQHFPTSLDDLTKPKTGIRFMRQAYKDPMNQEDGSWRLIYVGPNGQLIGSLSDRTLTLSGLGAAGAGTQPGGSLFSSGNNLTVGGATGSGASSFGSSNFGSSSFGSSGFGSSQAGSGFGASQGGLTTTNGPNGIGGNNAGPGAPGANGAGSTDDPLQPHSLAGSMDASNTIGGNIIGVGSKINKKSFLVYKHAKNYRQFEFIWDPSTDTTVGRASTGIGTPIQNSTGMTPAGSSSTPTSPFSSGVNPGQNTNQQQSPSQNQNPGDMNSNPTPPLQAPNQ